MRMEDSLGTLEEGKLADVIVVDGDVTSDIKILNDKSRLDEVISRGVRVDLNSPCPDHRSIPGWKVGNWAGEILTLEKAYE